MCSTLLTLSLDSESQLTYYQQVLEDVKATSLGVQLDVAGKGKGVISTRNISEGDTVFIERPLVSLQHLDNHGSVIVCQACLRFVGSVERQIGHKLHCLIGQLRGAQQGRRHTQNDDSDDDDHDEGVDLDRALEAGERLAQTYAHVTPERIAELCSGAVTLPLSSDFRLSESVPCRRCCGALYCGAACEAEAWDHSHCLLCPGNAPAAVVLATPIAADAARRSVTGTEAATSSTVYLAQDPVFGSAAPQPRNPGPFASSSGNGASMSAGAEAGPGPSTSAASSPSSSLGAGGPSASGASTSAAAAAGTSTSAAVVEEELHGIRVDRRALLAFWEHARETNEIFLLAAQVVAATLLRAARLLLADGQQARASSAGPAAASAAEGAAAAGGQQQQPEAEAADGQRAAPPGTADAYRSALLAAWQPYLYSWKRCWWDSVAVPDDVDDEEEFRGQLKSLASDSLELLSAAISDPRFGPDLLQLEVYGSIIGMFELNNMGLSVPSPVEDYFLAVDEMEEGEEKLKATQVTQPLLDALDSKYATPCEATAFLALQSCINHSCDPNCTAACDTGDRTVTVMAQRDIPAGEEITLSYIDVTLPYKERQAELRDYGFVCRCSRCVADSVAARAKRQGVAGKGGVKVGRRR